MNQKMWLKTSCINVGKKGLTSEVIEEIKRRIKQEKAVKVKILSNCPLRGEFKDRKELANFIATKTEAKVLGVRGYTVILAKRKSRSR